MRNCWRKGEQSECSVYSSSTCWQEKRKGRAIQKDGTAVEIREAGTVEGRL